MMHDSQYVTNSPTLKKIVGCKVLHFINNEDQKALGYKTLKHKDAVAAFGQNQALGHFLHVFSLYILM